MEREGYSQASLAKAANVSQPTISRALREVPIRHGSARERLFKYTGISDPNIVSTKAESLERLVAAFERIWAQSDVHADAIARIVDALADAVRPARDTK
jgi:transcriptional regulator with XRE-family HTH domain